MDNIREDKKKRYENKIEPSEEDTPVEHLWRVFKNGLIDSIKKHIHQETISGRWDVPWRNRVIKWKLHQKQRLYKKTRRIQTDQDRHKVKNLRKYIKELLRNVHDSYVIWDY